VRNRIDSWHFVGCAVRTESSNIPGKMYNVPRAYTPGVKHP
jgi:hypothetical protein